MTLGTRWHTWRSLLLLLVFGGVVGVIMRIILVPPPEKSTDIADSLVYPTTVPLPQWQLVATEPIVTSTQTGHLYQYRREQFPASLGQGLPLQQARSLSVSTYYKASTDGSVNRYLVVHTSLRPATVNLQLKYQDDVGYYSLFRHENLVYLSACINPFGNTTVTEQQFTRNQSLHSLSVRRIFFWLLGQNELFDSRCLWTLMSTPVESDSSIDQEQALEAAWVNWYRWWQDNFP